jgi:hypothetical protein
MRIGGKCIVYSQLRDFFVQDQNFSKINKTDKKNCTWRVKITRMSVKITRMM